MYKTVYVTLAVLLCSSFLVNGEKILVTPEDGSNWLSLRAFVEELHSRGHEVTVLMPTGSFHIKQESPFYKIIQLKCPPRNEVINEYTVETVNMRLNGASGLSKFLKEIQFLGSYAKWQLEMLREVCENTKLMDDLRDAKYDLVLSDPLAAAGVYISHHLGIPLVIEGILTLFDNTHFLIAPSPVSFVPIGQIQLTDKMTFTQRVENFIALIAGNAISWYMNNLVINDHPVIQKYFGGSYTNFREMLQAADIWLTRTDFTLEFSRPTMPNFIYVSGYHCKHPKPLPKELDDFLQSSGEHGAIIMSLGSLVSTIPEYITEDIAAAFAQLPQKVIWKHIGKRPSTLGNNTLLMDWLPQSDLLGHPKTRLFVTHGGINGVQEAIYHGVPMVGLPILFDQPGNIFKMEAKGVAKKMNIEDLNKENFLEALKEVLYDPSYSEKIKILSKLHRDQPMKPLDTAMFWTEFVMKHKGAPHLKSESCKMSVIQYYSVDVMAFLLAVSLLLFTVSTLAVRFMWQRVFSRSKVKKE